MRTLFAALVTAGFIALLAYEVHHDLIVREPWPGYGLLANAVVILHAPFWLAGAVSVWIRRRVGWIGVIAGASSLVIHGIGVTAGGSQAGALFVVAGPVLLVLTALARRAGRAKRAARAERAAQSPMVATR
jgi:hypothetical protein